MEKDFNWQNGIIDLSKPIISDTISLAAGWFIQMAPSNTNKMATLIGANRLRNDDWILHLLEKSWVDMNDFIPASFSGDEKYRHTACNHKVLLRLNNGKIKPGDNKL